MELTIQISKTSTGDQDYMQIMSSDMISVNIVLVADKITLRDDRILEEKEDGMK